MAIITSRANLNQGGSLAVAGAIFATGTGADIRIHTSASNNLPALAVGEFFEIRDHSNSQNNGLFQVVTVTTSTDDYECDKVTATAPIVAGAEAITTLGATGTSTEKSVHYDVAGLGVYLLEQGNLGSDGVDGKALYSFTVQEYKDDNYLPGNMKFPMLCVDSDAGKYFIGQNPSGINTGWNWVDDSGFSIRTRKLLRNMGWDELDANGITTSRFVGIVTQGVFEDPATDTAFYEFGADTTVDNTVDFDFPDAVNEGIQFYEEQTQTDLAITATTIIRIGGSFITEGYKVGGQVTIRNAEDSANDGDWVLIAVTALVLTTSGLTVNADDTAARLSVNNDNALTLGLRVRDGDPNGKTFAQSNLVTINKTALSNFVYFFSLANATDLNISETDANIDANTPYTGMSLTFYASGQSRGGLVGGPFNFGFIMDGNNGTNTECFEWLQRQLRKLSDIDAGAGTNFGRSMELMARFNGDILEAGSPDGGLNFPSNPEGGGSGIYIDSLNAASANKTKFWDNTGTLRSAPETIAVTVDANQTAIDDTAYKYNLFYDRTIRTACSDFVLTNATSKITSAGTNLPTSDIAVDKYIRIDGLIGIDAAMNGIYQITTITTPGADWTVVRYDGATIVDVTVISANVDQYPIDSPDKIIVHTNTGITDTTISFTAPDTINDSGNGFGIFTSGDIIEIEGTTNNDGIYEVDTAAVGQLTTIEQTIVNESAGSSFTITKIFSGLVAADITENYDFDGNVQGGRTVSTDTYIQARGVGLLSGQYTESTVQTIASGTPTTVPLTAQIERNVA